MAAAEASFSPAPRRPKPFPLDHPGPCHSLQPRGGCLGLSRPRRVRSVLFAPEHPLNPLLKYLLVPQTAQTAAQEDSWTLAASNHRSLADTQRAVCLAAPPRAIIISDLSYPGPGSAVPIQTVSPQDRQLTKSQALVGILSLSCICFPRV